MDHTNVIACDQAGKIFHIMELKDIDKFWTPIPKCSFHAVLTVTQLNIWPSSSDIMNLKYYTSS